MLAIILNLGITSTGFQNKTGCEISTDNVRNFRLHTYIFTRFHRIEMQILMFHTSVKLIFCCLNFF